MPYFCVAPEFQRTSPSYTHLLSDLGWTNIHQKVAARESATSGGPVLPQSNKISMSAASAAALSVSLDPMEQLLVHHSGKRTFTPHRALTQGCSTLAGDRRNTILEHRVNGDVVPYLSNGNQVRKTVTALFLSKSYSRKYFWDILTPVCYACL